MCTAIMSLRGYVIGAGVHIRIYYMFVDRKKFESHFSDRLIIFMKWLWCDHNNIEVSITRFNLTKRNWQNFRSGLSSKVFSLEMITFYCKSFAGFIVLCYQRVQ